MAKLKNVGLCNFVIGRIAQSKHKQSICYLYESASESLDVKNVGKAKSEKSDKMQKKKRCSLVQQLVSANVSKAAQPSTMANLVTVVRPLWSPGRDAGNAQRSSAGRGGGLK